jgi:hypothetical protein
MVDENEAPEGYVAVLKATISDKHNCSICFFCDWRSECKRGNADFSKKEHRCMSQPVITDHGEEISRDDGCSVIFIRKKNNK